MFIFFDLLETERERVAYSPLSASVIKLADVWTF